MRIVLQRVQRARVTVGGKAVGRIGCGMVLLVGIGKNDNNAALDYLAHKVLNLRIFADEQGKMNRSLLDVNGEMLAISQFTLYGDTRKGRRPSFDAAAPPEQARPLFDRFVDTLRASGLKVDTGQFGAAMQVELVNDGPVTFVLESPVS